MQKPAEMRKRGAPVKAGKEQVRSKAAVILAKSQPLSNPVAEALGLGPCMIVAPTDTARTNNRPHEKLSAVLGHRKREAHYVPSYHITWAAEYGAPSDVPVGWGYSHRCHQKWCVAPGHGTWESNRANQERNSCADGKSHFLLSRAGERHLLRICPHTVGGECLSGTAVEDMNHPAITRIP